MGKKRKISWRERSIKTHMVTYILVIFGIYAVVFIVMLYNAYNYYEGKVK